MNFFINQLLTQKIWENMTFLSVSISFSDYPKKHKILVSDLSSSFEVFPLNSPNFCWNTKLVIPLILVSLRYIWPTSLWCIQEAEAAYLKGPVQLAGGIAVSQDPSLPVWQMEMWSHFQRSETELQNTPDLMWFPCWVQ